MSLHISYERMNVYAANNKRNKIYDVLARRDVKYLSAISITSNNTSVFADSLHKTRYALLVISIRIPTPYITFVGELSRALYFTLHNILDKSFFSKILFLEHTYLCLIIDEF